MKIDKKAINYYYSFFEVSKELNQKQFYEFNMAIYKVMFFEEHIDNITFQDTMLTILWKSVKHSVLASVQGYCTKKSIPYEEVFAPLSKPLDNPLANKNNEQEQGQVQEKEQVEQSSPLIISETYDDSLRLSNYLFNNILKVNPAFKTPNLETWAKDIDKAIRIDKRTVSQLKDCIDWIYSDKGEFWQKNILSGRKLREKFDTMNMQVITKPKSKQEVALSESAKAIYNAMKRRGHSEEEIQEELRKIA